MSDYTKSTNFASKDSLSSGNPLKIVKGTEIDTEFNNIATAVATKADSANAALTGTPTAPTATAGTSSTQIATTAFVQNIAGSLKSTTSITSNTTLTASDVGKLVALNSSTAFTVTLPLISAIADGNLIEFCNINSAPVTIQRQGSDNIKGGTANITSFVINPGERVTLTVLSTVWVATSGSAQLQFSVGLTGAMMFFAMSTAPIGWLAADGSNVSRTTYAALYSTIGTTFGSGDGSTTFTLPDLRGKFPRGYDNGRGVDSGRVFGSSQNDALQNITGSFTLSAEGTPSFSGAFYSSGSSGDGVAGAGGAFYTVEIDASRVARTATETRPTNVALLACIKY